MDGSQKDAHLEAPGLTTVGVPPAGEIFEALAAEGIDKPHLDILEAIAQAGAEVLGAHAAGLYVIYPGREELVFESVGGMDSATFERYRGGELADISALVAASGQPMAVSSSPDDQPDSADAVSAESADRLSSVLGVPMIGGSDVIGVLVFYDKRGPVPFSPGDIRVATAFASVASLVLAQSLHREAVRERSDSDGSQSKVAKIARLLRELVHRDDRELQLGIDLLTAAGLFHGVRPETNC